MNARIKTVSAITLKVAQIEESARFYQGVLGLEIVYGGPGATFTSLRIPDAKFPLINLQLGRPTTDCGRIIFHVSDVDALLSHLKQTGFKANSPADASWESGIFTWTTPTVTGCRLHDLVTKRGRVFTIFQPDHEPRSRFCWHSKQYCVRSTASRFLDPWL